MIQYAKEFLILQVRFAQKIAEVSDQTLENVLIDHTMLRNLFNLRVSHDIPNPLWDEFIKGFCASDNLEDWTYNFYLQRMAAEPDASDERPIFWVFLLCLPVAAAKKTSASLENRETSDHGDIE